MIPYWTDNPLEPTCGCILVFVMSKIESFTCFI